MPCAAVPRVASLIALVFLAACATTTPSAPPVAPPVAAPPPAEPLRWPTAAWETAPPDEVGVDPARLAALLEALAREELHVHSLLVVRRGRLALEAYAWLFHPEALHDVASVTKSVTGTLVGIALDERRLPGLDATLPALFPGRSRAAAPGVTLRHLLTMTAGLECVNEAADPGAGAGAPALAEATLAAMLAAPDPVLYSLSRPSLVPPGRRWCYDSAGSHLLAGAVVRAVREDLAAYARPRLFGPIGVRDVAWAADSSGLRRGFGDLRMRPRDMARLGYLFLHGGRWGERQVVPSDWVTEATRDQTGGVANRPEAGYGYQWWLDRGGAFFAAGRGGQYIYVAPALDLVVVTTGGVAKSDGDRLGALLREHLAAAARPGDERVPFDPTARSRLARAVSTFAAAPAPRPAEPFPAVALDVAARPIALRPNPAGWKTVALHFMGTAAMLEVRLSDGGTGRFAIGLDGVPRVTPGQRYGVDAHHDGGVLALAGEWTDPRTFVVTFDTLDRIDRGTVTFHFPSFGHVSVTLDERTQSTVPVALGGQFVVLPLQPR